MTSVPPALQPPDAAIPIRPVTRQDFPVLRRTCWSSRPESIAKHLLLRVLRNQRYNRGGGVVALNAERHVIGYGQFTLWSTCAELSDLFVVKQYRSQGYGTAIIQSLAQRAVQLKAPCLEIGAAESNPRALALYKRLGFEHHRRVMLPLEAGPRQPVIYLRLPVPDAT